MKGSISIMHMMLRTSTLCSPVWNRNGRERNLILKLTPQFALMDQYQYYSDEEEFFDARSHATRSDASFMTAKQGTASIASRARSKLNEVAVLSELEGFEEGKDEAAPLPSTPAPPIDDQELPPTPHPPFLNHLYESEEQRKRDQDQYEDPVVEADHNPLFEAIDLPLPPPPSSWNKKTISPSGSDHQRTSVLHSDVETVIDQAPIALNLDPQPVAAGPDGSPPERRAFRTLSGIVDKLLLNSLKTDTPSKPPDGQKLIMTPPRSKVDLKLMHEAAESPVPLNQEVSTPTVIARDDQSLMQAAKGSTGRNPIARLRSPSPALTFPSPSPQSLNKPPPLILPFGADLKSPLPSPSPSGQSPMLRKATVTVGSKFLVDQNGAPAFAPLATPGSRGKPMRSSVKSILSSCFYPNEASKWDVVGPHEGAPRLIECQQYVVTYE